MDEIDEMSVETKTNLMRRVFDSEDGKQALAILKRHFQADLPSAPICGFDTNQTMYRDGQKSVFSEIHQIIDGLYLNQPKINKNGQ